MPDDSMQQLAQPAAVGGIGGLVGIVLALLGSAGGSKEFVRRAEMETAIANVKLQAQAELTEYKVEVAEKYITRDGLKELLKPFEENLTYIRDRVDALGEHIHSQKL